MFLHGVININFLCQTFLIVAHQNAKKIDNICIFSLQTDTDGLPTLKSIAQEATNRAGLKVPLSQASTQQAQMSVPGSTAPSISQSGKSLVTAFFSSLYPLDLKRPFINYADMILRIFDLPSMKSYCISLCSSVDIWLPCSPSLSAYFMNCP